ncbi:MAG: hypothetical protein ABI398_07625 [Devosia sp.]
MFKAFPLAARIVALAAIVGLTGPVAPAMADSRDDYLIQICQGILARQPHIVRKEAVAAIGPDARVTIHPLCMDIDIQDLGNAAGLGKTIARNPNLAAALARRGWRGDDVTGIVIHGNAVDLYVHR